MCLEDVGDVAGELDAHECNRDGKAARPSHSTGVERQSLVTPPDRLAATTMAIMTRAAADSPGQRYHGERENGEPPPAASPYASQTDGVLDEKADRDAVGGWNRSEHHDREPERLQKRAIDAVGADDLLSAHRRAEQSEQR